MANPNYLGLAFGLANPFTALTTLDALYGDIRNPNVDVLPGVGSPFGTQGIKNTGWTSKHVLGEQQDKTGSSGNFSGAYNGSGAGSGVDAETAAARAQIDQGIQQNQEAYDRTFGQQNTAFANLENQYNSAYNKLLGDQAVTRRDYETNVTNQNQDYLNARENVANNSRNMLTGARRLLGAQGAGGGSADRYTVPNAVQLEQSNKNAVVQQTNARNLGALATANEDNDRKYKSGFEDLSNQLSSSKRSTQSQFEQQRADLLNAIAQLNGQKAIANGGDTNAALAAARPYMDRVSSILNTIDSLAANPGVVRANAINLSRPDLAAYAYDRFTAPIANSAPAQDTSLTLPAYAALLGDQRQDDQRQQLV